MSKNIDISEGILNDSLEDLFEYEEKVDDADVLVDSPVNPISRPGDLWLINEHRLLCGDSTKSSDVDIVMAGDRANLLFTSPPYWNKRDYESQDNVNWDNLMKGVFVNIPMCDDGQVLVNLGLFHHKSEWHSYWDNWINWMRSKGWRRFGLYVWDQGTGIPGDWGGRLAPSFEFIFHFNRVGRKPNKIERCSSAGKPVEKKKLGLRQKDGSFNKWSHQGSFVQPFRIPDNVIRVERQHGSVGNNIEHPAVFPVRFPEYIIKAFTNENEIVFEPFCGSGSSIIAAERTKRRIRAIEINPKYVDVCLIRWRRLYPYKPAILASENKSFVEISNIRNPA